MKKHTEKQPIDDLFARKLGNASLPPSPDSFKRLQARMGQNKSDVRIVFWQNPAVQRYMAAAACLLLVSLFGWLYWPSDLKTTPEGPRVATRQTLPVRPQKPVEEPLNPLADNLTPDTVAPDIVDQKANTEQIAKAEKHSESSTSDNRSIAQPNNVNKAVREPIAPVPNEPVLAQTKPADKVNPDATIPQDVTPVSQSIPESVATVDIKTTVKPAPTAERVLVVTIDEPSSLAVARQVAKASADEKPVVVVNDKPEKEIKANGLWQQVKRIKQGEVLARRDNTNNDERGLLSRAYDGLKHSFDKDKSAKQ